MPIGGLATNTGVDAETGAGLTDGTDGTAVGGVPTAAGAIGVAAGASAASGTGAGPMLGGGCADVDAGRSGLLPLTGTVLVGAEARGAVVGRLAGRVPAVAEAVRGVAGGHGKPAMRYRVQSTLSWAKAWDVRPAIAVRMHSGTQQDSMRRPVSRISDLATAPPNRRLCCHCVASPALPAPGGPARG